MVPLRLVVALATLSVGAWAFQERSDVRYMVDKDNDVTVMHYDGEVLLGAVLPLRTRGGDQAQDLETAGDRGRGRGSVCGGVNLMQGLQSLAALTYTLDWVNNRSVSPTPLPFRLGAVIYDCCQNAQVAVENTINFILPSLIRPPYGPGFESGNSTFSSGNTDPEEAARVVGVIGAADSEVSVALASVLGPLKMPQISFLSTSRDLSNTDHFKFFARTVPNDTHSARVLVDILKKFNWTVISAVFDDTNYGIRGFADFERVASQEKICFSLKERLQTGSPDWGMSDYNETVAKLIQQSHARVVVLYVSTITLTGFLRAARHFKADMSKLVWIGTESWFSCDDFYKEENKVVTSRAIVLTPSVQKMPQGYTDYWRHIWPHLNSTRQNPWLAEYVEQTCDCFTEPSTSFPGQTTWLPTRTNQSCRLVARQCLSQKWSSNDSDPQLPRIVMAVLAYAHALKRIAEQDKCPQRRDFNEPLCDAINPRKLNRERLMKTLRSTEFQYDNRVFRFENGVDGPAEYSVLFWDEDHWDVGGSANSSSLDEASLRPRFLASSLLKTASRCEVCGSRQARQVNKGTCCWTCVTCTAEQLVIRANWSCPTTECEGADSDECRSCESGSYANYPANRCVSYQDETIRYASWQSVIVLFFCIIGLFITLLAVICFSKYRHTPVVKACGRETSVCLLLAAALSYAAPFAMLAPPSYVVCSITRCAIGLCQTFAYAAMFTKALRIAVIFRANQAHLNATKYCTAKFQAYAILLLIGVETLIQFSWLMYARSEVRDDLNHIDRTFEKACTQINTTYTVVLIVPACILLVAAVFAFKIRKTPDGFNDSKNLGFVIYTNCALMVAVLPTLVAPTLAYKSRIFSLCILLYFNASSILYGLLLPKVYICVWRPEKNTKQAVMNRSRAFATVNATNANRRLASFTTLQVSGEDGTNDREQTSTSCSCCRFFTASNKLKRDDKSFCDDAPIREDENAQDHEEASTQLLDPVSVPLKLAGNAHADVCSCKCECCINWDKLAAMSDEHDGRKMESCNVPSNVPFDSGFSTLKPAAPQALSARETVFNNDHSDDIKPE